MDYSCSEPAQILTLNKDLSGDIAGRFKNYDAAENRRIVELGLRNVYPNLPQAAIDTYANYPETERCEDAAAPRDNAMLAEGSGAGPSWPTLEWLREAAQAQGGWAF